MEQIIRHSLKVCHYTQKWSFIMFDDSEIHGSVVNITIV